MPVVQLEVSAGEAELAADALWGAAPSAVGEEVLADGRVRLTADIADPDALDPRWPVRVVEVAADVGLDGWRDWARPHRAGRHVVLQPAWLEPIDRRPGDLVVRLEPGHTFGSGSHPSTCLVAAVLEDRVVGGESVLDVGCGSGVLSVVACLLGATRAVAIDVVPDSVAVTQANAAANGVGAQVAASTTPVEEVEGAFDVVLANIGPGVLRDLAGPLAAVVASGGLLVLAGLLDHQVPELLDGYPTWQTVEVRSRDGWAAVVLTR